MSDFIDIQFPVDISYGSHGGPEYYTDIVTTKNGGEQRNYHWLQPKNKYNISYGIKTKQQLEQIIKLFH